MNTKEMIGKLERYSFQIGKVFKCYGLEVDEVIDLLKNGKKYKQIVEDVRQIDWLKQKYFPESKEIEIDWKDRFYELEEEFEEKEKELIQQIEYWKFEYYKKGEIK